MASLDETKDVKTTADTFSATVREIVKGDDFKFYLYYDNGGGSRTAIVNGDEWKSTGQTEHEFKKDGLRANADLMFTIAYLPPGKTDWTKNDDILYVAQRSTTKTKAETPSKTWPGDWTKWSNITSWDVLHPISHDVWNDFLDHINEVIDYKGGTQVTFTKATAEQLMTADYFNNGAAAAMKKIGLSPPTASKDGDITPAFFKNYGDALNAAK